MIKWSLNYQKIDDYPAFKKPSYGLFVTVAGSYPGNTHYIGIRSVKPGLVVPIELVGWWSGHSCPEELIEQVCETAEIALWQEVEHLYGIERKLPF